MRSESFRKGLKDGLPIGLGYFAVSFTFDFIDKCNIRGAVCGT